MNLKKHFKLYKSGKLWITAAIATLALTTGVAATSTNASADANTNAPQQNGAKQPNDADGNKAVLTAGKQASGADKGNAAASDQNSGDSAKTSDNNTQAGKDKQNSNSNNIANKPSDNKGDNGKGNQSSNSGNNNTTPNKDDNKGGNTNKPSDTPNPTTETATYERTIIVHTTDSSKPAKSSTAKATYSRTVTPASGSTKQTATAWKADGNGIGKYEITAIKGYVSYYTIDNDSKKHYGNVIDADDPLTGDQLKNGTTIKHIYNVYYDKGTSQKTIDPTNLQNGKPVKGEEDLWLDETRTVNFYIRTDKSKESYGSPRVDHVWFKRSRVITTTVDPSTGAAKDKVSYSEWKLADKNVNSFPSFIISALPGYRTVTGDTNFKDIQAIPEEQAKTPTNNAENQGVPQNTYQDIYYTTEINDPINRGLDQNLHGNWAWIDSLNVDHDSIHVVGWNATDQSYLHNYHYIFVLDYGQNPARNSWDSPFTEVGRVLVQQPVDRPDVKNIYKVWNAGRSGFDVSVPLTVNNIHSGDKLAIMSRWTSDPYGNTDTIDKYGNFYTIDYNTNAGCLDDFSIVKNENGKYGLHVAGWNASNQHLGRPYRYLILWDNTLGHEVRRIKISDHARQDVANAYPTMLNAGNSGFEDEFDLSGLDLTHSYQIISRYSTAANGEGSNVDYWFPSKRFYNGTVGNYAWLDSVSYDKPGQITVSGWHANDISSMEPNHFLILFDNTANKQLGSIKITANKARSDVKSAYKSIAMAGQSGFSGTFDNIQIIPGHAISLVSRYSLSADGNGGDSAYTDYWMSLDPKFLIKDESRYYIDGTSVNADGSIHLNGWMASGYSFSDPHAFLFIMDKNYKEVARQAVNLTARQDVQRFYPNMYNAQNSGFNATIKLNADQQKQVAAGYTIMMRFSNSADGNPLANVDNSTFDLRDATLRSYTIPEKKPQQPAKPDKPSSDNPNNGQSSKDTHNSGTTNPGKQTSDNTGKQTSDKGKDSQQQSQSGQSSNNGKDQKQTATTSKGNDDQKQSDNSGKGDKKASTGTDTNSASKTTVTKKDTKQK